MAKEQVHDIFESIAKDYDSANDRISFGLHRRWKKRLVDITSRAAALGDRGMVLDCCCGTGDITEALAKRNPGVLVVGLDFSESMLDVARHRTKDLDNVMLVQGDAMTLPFDEGTFDATVVSFGLRNLQDYGQAVSEMSRVTRKGGIVACLDASVPDDPVVFPFYTLYYKYIMVILGGGPAKIPEYSWLYQSTQDFLRKKELAALFENNGLRDVEVQSFMMGAAALHVGTVWR